MSRHRSFILVMLVLCVLGASLGVTGARETRNWALRNEANATGMDWTRHMENKLATIASKQRGYAGIPENEIIDAMLSDVIAVGNIYQIDYVNAFCFCDLSVGSFRDHTAVSQGHDHEHPATPSGRMSHLLNSQSAHKPIDSGTTSDQLPIDRAVAQHMIATNAHDIILRNGDGKFQPTTYAEVYHSVYSDDGQPAYLLRVLVNLEAQAANFNRFFLIAVVLVGLIMTCLVGYPTWRYSHSSKQRQAADNRAMYLARHDVLTGLHNRNDFQVYLEETLDECRETGQSALLYMFDLNSLKAVNDYLGHYAGDSVLVAFARLLQTSVATGGYIARLGSDEFVVVIRDLPQRRVDFADHLDVPKTLSIWIDDAKQAAKVSITGGVAQFPHDATTVSGLMQAVDLAHMSAKSDSNGQVRAYTSDMKTAFHNLQTLRNSFTNALNKGDVRPHYQPIMNLKTGQIEGFEALARWYQDDGSILTPASFHEVIEDDEIGGLLGEVMFSQIVDDMARWRAHGVPFESVGLNVVDADLKRPDFASNILDALEKRGIPANCLAIEVTENCLFHEGTSHFIDQLTTLRNKGCWVALDDFGTGYTSISQLKNLPFTAIKIDKSFVTDVLDSSADQAIVSALQYLGKAMAFKVVIEGIETQEQNMFFKNTGFALSQGYFVSRPMPAADVPIYLHDVSNQQTAIAG